MEKREVMQWLIEDFTKHANYALENFQRSRSGTIQKERYRVMHQTWTSAIQIVNARLTMEFPETRRTASEFPGLTPNDGHANIKQ